MWKAAVYLVVIAVLGAATILMARNVLSDGPEEITLPSVDTSDTWITDTAPPYPTVPDTPTKRGATVDSAGKSVVYQATINGVGVLAYSDDTGTRTDVISEPEWKVTFTGTGAPLRLLVVATSEARCRVPSSSTARWWRTTMSPPNRRGGPPHVWREQPGYR